MLKICYVHLWSPCIVFNTCSLSSYLQCNAIEECTVSTPCPAEVGDLCRNILFLWDRSDARLFPLNSVCVGWGTPGSRVLLGCCGGIFWTESFLNEMLLAESVPKRAIKYAFKLILQCILLYVSSNVADRFIKNQFVSCVIWQIWTFSNKSRI